MASSAGLTSMLRLFVVAKLCPLWGKSKPCLPKSWQIIANFLRGKFMAKKLDLNNDGTINKTEINGRIVAMIEKMDSNGDGGVDDKKTIKMRRHHYGMIKNRTGGYSK
jgi:hypothetical protein